MVDKTLKPALRLALRLHEIGGASPYQISFAGKGKSGASFGFMQGDLAAGQPVVRQTFHDALSAAAFSAADIATFLSELSVPLITCPVSNVSRLAINAALLAGRASVDVMDETILGGVYDDLDLCQSAASAFGMTILPKALIYIAMWVNMTGKPTSLLKWLEGETPALRQLVPPAADPVDGPAMETYLLASDYFVENPSNWPQMLQCAAAGFAILGTGVEPAS